MSKKTYKHLWSDRELLESPNMLCSYGGHELKELGGLNTDVLYLDQQANLTLTIVEGDGPTLLGCDWLKQLRLNWKVIFALCQHL